MTENTGPAGQAKRLGIGALERRLATRNLRSDAFGTWSAILGVALGVATVNVVLVIDANTRTVEAKRWSTNPDLPVDTASTITLTSVSKAGTAAPALDAKTETHEDYQVMRSAIRLGSLSAFLTGALIVFFTFRVVVEQRRREIALLRSLGASRGQVARVLVLEAAIVGLLGALFGFALSPILSIAAAMAGFTTTGRATISWLWFPWKTMAAVSMIGAVTALLGIWRPARDVLRLDVARTLRPQFLDPEAPRARSGSSGVLLITLPFMALVYVLVRPFFVEVLPSLTFFVFEAGLVTAGFLALLVVVPEVVRGLGGLVAQLLPARPLAPRLLTLRRIQRSGHELAWSVSGVMLVFALLLALHVVTHALKVEVVRWGEGAVRDKTFVTSMSGRRIDPKRFQGLPEDVVLARFSGRTPWPNAVLAVEVEDLERFTAGAGEAIEGIGRSLRRGKVVLSRMMARRFGIGVGDFLELGGPARTASLEVIAVTDDFGYTPMIGPYRNSKTYALISSEDFDLIEAHATPIGSSVALRFAGPTPATLTDALRERWRPVVRHLRDRSLRVEVGFRMEEQRVAETDRDFAMFDVILFFTALLASIGIANNLVLSAHARQREIALYRVLGMEVPRVRVLFLMEGAFVGLLGGLLAVALGIPLGFAAIGALEVISAFEVHFDLPWTYPLAIVGAAITVSLLSALYPARRAAELGGAESVHYE